MPIIGGRVKSVSAKRLGGEKLEGMNVNLNVKDVKKEKDDAIVEYAYTISYAPDVAEMVIEGEVRASGKDAEEVIRLWKEKKLMPQSFTEEMLTSLTYSSSAIGTLLAFAINVNAPINVAPVRIAGQQTKAA